MINERLGGSGDASSLAVENEHVISGKCADVPGSTVAAQEFDFQATEREQLDDGPHVARMNLRVVRAVEYGHHVQLLQLSCTGHVNRPRTSHWATEYSR